MKSLIQAVAIAVVLAAPVASFAQSSNDAASQAVQAQASGQQQSAQTDNSGYGSGSHGTWQAGYGNDTTVSSYSPPIRNIR
ncbi:hypothetical protein [Paraburkholderia aromaticivorans]|jgi:FlaG/FlaF family flagellin (archaellin)|uniref:hypothetical protein n=1 Tax=Paraburkholderia aromaticivorans TaxID=2026199 RepID=UPI0038B8B2A2